MKLRETERGLILDVYVKPRSREFRIMVEGDEIVVHCSEEPVGGRARARQEGGTCFWFFF